MSVNGFKVNNVVEKYNYNSLDNIPDLEGAIAGNYSTTSTYNVGDYVWYNGTLYRCTTAITTAEAWTAAHWTAEVIGNDVSDVKNAISLDGSASIAPLSSNIVAIPSAFHDGYLIRSDGTKQVVSGYGTSSYIKINPNAVYIVITLNGSGESFLWISLYDSEKTFISGIEGAQMPRSITTPSTAKYMTVGGSSGLYQNICIINVNYELTGVTIANVKAYKDSDFLYNLIKAQIYREYSGYDNLLNKTTWAKDIYRGGSGNDSSAIGWQRSDFIPVSANTKYYASSRMFVAYYRNDSGIVTFLSGETEAVPEFTTPANCNTVVVSCNYYEGDIYPWLSTVKYNEKNIANNAFESIEQDIYNGHLNKALLTYWKDDVCRNTEGTDLPASGWRRSWYIPVSGGTVYKVPSTTFVCYYSSAYVFLSGTTIIDGGSFTTPENCAFIVVTYNYDGVQHYWVSESDLLANKTIYVGSNEQYTTIRSAMAYANAHDNTTVIVRKGTYDIVSEYGGQSSMPSTEGSTGLGMRIGQGTKLYFEEGAVVECIYTGGNANTECGFSIFNASQTSVNDNFEINGLVCRAKNIRYCVHDEMSSQSAPYTHKYINCNMYLDNTESSWTATQCIGGGLGDSGNIIVENCIFETGEDDGIGVSWHNHWRAGSKSDITIKDCYFRNCGIEFYNYGQQTENTICKVSNNAVAFAPRVNGYSEQPEKIELLAWNNVILQ